MQWNWILSFVDETERISDDDDNNYYTLLTHTVHCHEDEYSATESTRNNKIIIL